MSKQSEPENIEILGKPFVCIVCNNNQFYQGKAQLNTALATFLNFDWANRTAIYIECSNCGHMSWFKQKK